MIDRDDDDGGYDGGDDDGNGGGSDDDDGRISGGDYCDDVSGNILMHHPPLQRLLEYDTL